MRMPIKSEVIANPKAERIRRVAELADRKGRKRSGRFMVEGPQSVRELLAWHPDMVEDLYVEVTSAEPDAAFITPIVAQMAGKAMQAGAYVHKVTHDVMRRMSSDAQGVLAVAGHVHGEDGQVAELVLADQRAGLQTAQLILIVDALDLIAPHLFAGQGVQARFQFRIQGDAVLPEARVGCGILQKASLREQPAVLQPEIVE